jgi:hypothetical protein
VNTLPTERDLPPATREALRARVVELAKVRVPGPRFRRWLPAAAAAGLAAVIAGSAVAVSAGRTVAPSAPAGTATSPSPAGDPRIMPLEQVTRVEADARLQAQVDDLCLWHRSRVLLAVRTPWDTIAVGAPGATAFACAVLPDGNPGPGGSGVVLPPGARSPLPAPATADAGGSSGQGVWLSTFSGKVTRQVRRVILTFPDGRTMAATVGNGVYVAVVRVRLEDGGPSVRFVGEQMPVTRAYGGDGTLLWDSRRGDLSCAKGPGRCRYPWP